MVTCPSCASEQTAASKFCSECGAELLSEFAKTVLHEAASSSQSRSASSDFSDSSHHGRFLPGTIVGDRYRIVSRVGRGGMGEVYRADDLKLGHTVALKFLPKDLADDQQRLDYFHSEVRLTRQISHPNICRVYDIGEVEGQHFLSMEYIDGEDLKALLRRIGRLPHDKGVETAQQLCVGLAAAHERGVLHRDLKPANIMIDGRGHVRITDFGLAKLTGDEHAGEIAGTPAYMAPEQLRDGTTSIQSDLYSLGLILYELFTGESISKSSSIPELIKQREDSLPLVSSSVAELDPVVERVIERCLQKVPHDRPQSARAVSAALPGGDPLAATLAAGETPSPEMLVAAGEQGVIRPGIAFALIVFVLACIAWRITQDFALQGVFASGQTVRTTMPLEPSVLAQRCQDNLVAIGFEEPFRDAVFGFTRGESKSRFWYRASQRVFRPVQASVFINPVSSSNPPPTTGDQVGMRLTPDGRMTEFSSVWPPSSGIPSADLGQPFDHDTARTLVALAGADFEQLEVTDPEFAPEVPVDQRLAWIGALEDGTRIRIEIGGYQGRLAWMQATSADDSTPSARRSSGSFPLIDALFLVLVVVAVVLAWRNIRLGRSNRSGAFRLAILVVAVHELYWLFSISRLPLVWDQVFADFSMSLSTSLYHGSLIGAFYLAMEPYVRRWWPEAIIGWTRLLSGRYRDPIVARDILVGIATAWALMTISGSLDPIMRELSEMPPVSRTSNLVHLMGARHTLGLACRTLIQGCLGSVFLMLMIVVGKAISGRLWAGALLPFLIIGALRFTVGGDSIDSASVSYAAWQMLEIVLGLGLPILVLIRFGSLASAIVIAAGVLGVPGPYGERLSDWSNQPYLWVLAGTAALAGCAFFAALAGRSLFPSKTAG